jgi:hypothetical protein
MSEMNNVKMPVTTMPGMGVTLAVSENYSVSYFLV